MLKERLNINKWNEFNLTFNNSSNNGFNIQTRDHKALSLIYLWDQFLTMYNENHVAHMIILFKTIFDYILIFMIRLIIIVYKNDYKNFIKKYNLIMTISIIE